MTLQNDTEVPVDDEDFDEGLDLPLYPLERLGVNISADRARNFFPVFRKIIRPGMLWGPFVNDITRELTEFYKRFIAGERPKLAISAPPQHGKSWAAEDFIAWVAGRCRLATLPGV
jgi:hypothetical protein